MASFIRKFTKGIEETASEDPADPLALLIRETVVTPVGYGIREVDFLVGHIEVAAENNGLIFLKPFEIIEK